MSTVLDFRIVAGSYPHQSMEAGMSGFVANITRNLNDGYEMDGDIQMSTVMDGGSMITSVIQKMVKYPPNVELKEARREMYERNVVEALLEELNDSYGDLGMSDIKFKEYIKEKLG